MESIRYEIRGRFEIDTRLVTWGPMQRKKITYGKKNTP